MCQNFNLVARTVLV